MFCQDVGSRLHPRAILVLHIPRGLRQLVERQLVERQLGDVNWSQRQLGATTISRSVELVVMLKTKIAKKSLLVLQRKNSKRSRKQQTIYSRSRSIRYENKYECLANFSCCVGSVTWDQVIVAQKFTIIQIIFFILELLPVVVFAII